MLPTDCQEFSNPSGDSARKGSSPDLGTLPETQPMDERLRAQIETYLSHLNGLIGRGRQLGQLLAADPSSASAIGAARVWQEDCGITINQLSGGSKAHWLARSFSQAFLMRSEDGHAVEGVAPAEIVQRLLRVLEQGVASLSQTDHRPVISASSEAPPPHRFDFVHNPELRPVVEQAYLDSRGAFEQREYETALLTACGILEAIVTDALEHKGLSALMASGAPAEKISDWSFAARLAVAERAGLIRGGCARLPGIARAYRDHTGAGGSDGLNTRITERDARQTGQVLRVVMRDLDPGR
ncbi:MAG: hypothetical protein WB762_20215 [Candidatus Sulfotelmatobacter sp.]